MGATAGVIVKTRLKFTKPNINLFSNICRILLSGMSVEKTAKI